MHLYLGPVSFLKNTDCKIIPTLEVLVLLMMSLELENFLIHGLQFVLITKT